MQLSIEWIIPFLLGFVLISAVAQLFWGYALSVIAEKDGQSDLMQILAWIPLLQMAPLIIAGGGSVGGFFLGVIGLIFAAVVLGLTSAFVGGAIGSAIRVLGLLFGILLSIVYFGRIASTTAATRELPGWVGLWVFVPFANLLVYPYMALHDGWRPPNKIGLIVGLVFTIGSTAPTFQAVQLMNQGGGLLPELAALLSGEASLHKFSFLEPTAASDGSDSGASAGDPRLSGHARSIEAESIKALYAMQHRFEKLRQLVESPELRKPEQRRAAMDLLRSINAELGAHRAALDERTYQELATHLMRSEARIPAASNESASDQPFGFAKASGQGKGPLSFSSLEPASLRGRSAPSPAPMRPIPVRPDDDCPNGTTLRTRVREDGEEEGCQQLSDQGGLRHGWAAHYYLEGGRPESMGEYSNGLRIGVWTRFYPSGRVRAQAEFVAGLQLALDVEP